MKLRQEKMTKINYLYIKSLKKTYVCRNTVKKLNQKVMLLFIMVTVTVILLIDNPLAECMYNGESVQETELNTTLNALAQGELTEDEARNLLTRINTENNPQQVERLRIMINNFARENNVDINNLLQPQLQHTIMNEGGNSGNIPTNNTAPMTIIGILKALGIFIIGSVIIYLFFRNWESIRDFLFDVGHRLVTLPGNASRNDIIRIAGLFLQNPEHSAAFRRGLYDISHGGFPTN